MKRNNHIQRLAKKTSRDLKHIISFEALEKYINDAGYCVIFYNTDVGDAEIKRYKLEAKAEKTKGFVYNSATTKIVFIDNDITAEDKRYILLHELGHILLGHLELSRISAENNILLDIAADAYAYEMITYHKNKPFLS